MINVKRVKIVLLPSGMDNIILVTDLPTTVQGTFAQPAEFMTYATRGTSEEWVKENLPDVPYEVINARYGN